VKTRRRSAGDPGETQFPRVWNRTRPTSRDPQKKNAGPSRGRRLN
jgi:hypothetical protein